MNGTMNQGSVSAMKRRSFIGYVTAALAGGFALRNLLPAILRSRPSRNEREQHITVVINPLAVPRTTKGRSVNG